MDMMMMNQLVLRKKFKTCPMNVVLIIIIEH